jgi:hypothetical protein
MSPYRIRLHRRLASLLLAAAALLPLAACGVSTQPQLKVLAFERPVRPSRPAILFVEVVNRDATPMRLQRLEYTFAAAGARRPGGEVSLARVVEPGGAVVVEVPVPPGEQPWPAGQRITIDGRLYAEQDELERSFPVTADLPADSFTR